MEGSVGRDERAKHTLQERRVGRGEVRREAADLDERADHTLQAGAGGGWAVGARFNFPTFVPPYPIHGAEEEDGLSAQGSNSTRSPHQIPTHLIHGAEEKDRLSAHSAGL